MVAKKLNNNSEEHEMDKKHLDPPKRIDNIIRKHETKGEKSNDDITKEEGRSNVTADASMGDSKTEDVKDEPSKIWVVFEDICSTIGVNPNLFFLKVTLFTMYGATACLIPYLTVHMQSIGLTVEDIGIIYLLLPLTTFLAPPVTGYLVDKLGNYKPVVIFSIFLNLIFHHVLLFIPHQELPGVMPAAYVVRHPDTGLVEVWWSPCPSRECPDEEELDMVLDDCVDYCLLQDDNPNIPKKRKIPAVPSNIAVMPPTMIALKTPNSFPGVHFGSDGPEKKKPSNKVEVRTKNGKPIRNENQEKTNATNGIKEDLRFYLGKNKTGVKNPTGNKRDDKMKKKNESSIQATDLKIMQEHPQLDADDATIFYVDMHSNLGDAIEQLGLEVEPDVNETVTDFRTRFEAELLIQAGVNVTALEEFDLRCGGIVMATNLTMIKLKELARDCMLLKCNFIDGGPEICPPDYKESDDRIFWIYFALRFIGTTMLSGCVTILDPIALMLIKEFGGEFGRERLFSSIGMAIFSPLTGVLIDSASSRLGYTDYSSAFYAYDILLVISAATVMLMPTASSIPADNILQDTITIIRMPHVVLFIFFLFLLGNFWGFIESYVFLYLRELGASNYLLGITVTVGTISSMPFLYGAEKITKKFGHVNIIVCSFFTHAVRLMGYSFIEEAWWCYPLEAMEALAVHLMWIAAATYCALLAPKNLLATLIGVLGMAHFSLGRGAGSFVGGLLIGTVGTRKSFRIMGIIAVIGGIAYYLLHYFWLRKLKAVKELEAQRAEEEAENLVADPEQAVQPSKPATRDVGISAERLSLMIEFHNRGSLTSLHRSLNSFQGGSHIIRSNQDVNTRRRSTSSLFYKNSAPNLPSHNSLSRDKVFRDCGTSCSPMQVKRSVETMTRHEESQSSRDAAAILEEVESERSSKSEMTSIGTP